MRKGYFDYVYLTLVMALIISILFNLYLLKVNKLVLQNTEKFIEEHYGLDMHTTGIDAVVIEGSGSDSNVELQEIDWKAIDL